MRSAASRRSSSYTSGSSWSAAAESPDAAASRSEVTSDIQPSVPVPSDIGPGNSRQCVKARVEPEQLRHAAGKQIRKHFGLEASQVAMGHSRADGGIFHDLVGLAHFFLFLMCSSNQAIASC